MPAENTPPLDGTLSNDAIGALANVHNIRSASYKFLWTRALLAHVEAGGGLRVSFEKLASAMLHDSVVPINRFKLNFGHSDKMRRHLRDIAQAEADAVKYARAGGKMDTHSAASRVKTRIHREVLQFVPHHWLTPFRRLLCAHGPPGRVDDKRAELNQLAEQAYNGERPMPYRFVGNGIELHPRWHDYFRRNMPVLKDWALWHWTNYLQARNPNIPAVANKIGFPESRNALNEERKFWNRVIRNADGIRCIYSDEPLQVGGYALDHYVPWTFVGHNRPWNLAPVTPASNAQKSDRLPHADYLESFIALHQTAIKTRNLHFQNQFTGTLVDAYCVDLQLTAKQLVAPGELHAALKRTMLPLIQIARNNSFEGDWRYSDGPLLD